MSSVQPVHRGPAVEPVTLIRRNALRTRDADESRHEAVVAVAMYRRRQAHRRCAHSLRKLAIAADQQQKSLNALIESTLASVFSTDAAGKETMTKAAPPSAPRRGNSMVGRSKSDQFRKPDDSGDRICYKFRAKRLIEEGRHADVPFEEKVKAAIARVMTRVDQLGRRSAGMLRRR
jgi:hypothetical protein